MTLSMTCIQVTGLVSPADSNINPFGFVEIHSNKIVAQILLCYSGGWPTLFLTSLFLDNLRTKDRLFAWHIKMSPFLGLLLQQLSPPLR